MASPINLRNSTIQRFGCLAVLSALLFGCSMPTGTTSSAQQIENAPIVLDTQEGNPEIDAPVADDSQAAVSQTDESTTAQTETVAPVLVPTASPLPTVEETVGEEIVGEVPEWLTMVTVEGDLYILGNPNAPIRLIDYSDFL